MSLLKFFKSPRKILFISVCLISAISALIFLITLKSNNRKFNQNLLTSALSLYSTHLEKNGFNSKTEDDKENLLIPFKVLFNKENSLHKYEYLEKNNELKINKNLINEEEYQNILEIIKKFAVIEKNATIAIVPEAQPIFQPIPIISTKLNIYKHINIFFLVHPEEDKNDYNRKEYLKLLKQLPKSMNIYIKFLLYDKFKGVVNAEDFYKDLKNYNSKIVFEELNDESSLNILLLNDKKRKSQIDVYYNKDINNDIYVFSFEQFLKSGSPDQNANILNKIINSRMLPSEIKQLTPDSEFLDILIKLYNSKNILFSRMLTESLNYLEKINKIFPLYESIRTIENVKEKLNSIQNNLIPIVKNNFEISDKNIENISKILIDAKYLMDSNELVSYEHFFSFEFK